MENVFPSISIIIPLYKVEDYITDCLQSVVDQDYLGRIECILVNDCSPDNSAQVAQQFIDSHKERVDFKLLHQESNKKQSAARNRGMSESTGDLIYFLDGDDWLDPDALSDMVKVMQKYPKCQIVQAGITNNKADEGCYMKWLMSKSWDHSIEYTEDRNWIIDTCAYRKGMIPMTPVSKLYRRDFIMDNNLRFVEGIYHEDEVWLVLLAKYLHSIAFVFKDSYHYVLHDNSTTNGGTTKRWNDLEQVWIEIFKLFDKDFCPQVMLKSIDFDTSGQYKDNDDIKVKCIMLRTKFRLMKFYSWHMRLRITKWMIQQIWIDITHTRKPEVETSL